MTKHYNRPKKAVSNVRDIAPGSEFWCLESFQGAKPYVSIMSYIAGSQVQTEDLGFRFVTCRSNKYPNYVYKMSLRDFNVIENKYNDHYLFLSYEDAVEAAKEMSKSFLDRYGYNTQRS